MRFPRVLSTLFALALAFVTSIARAPDNEIRLQPEHSLVGPLKRDDFRRVLGTNINKTKSASTAWSDVEISENTVVSLPYKEIFRIPVYKKEAKVIQDPKDIQYYYSPALIFDPTSVISQYNSLIKRSEMVFSVLMWDEEFEDFVRRGLSEHLGIQVSPSNVRILPIEQIRVESKYYSEECEVMNKWSSYGGSQPAMFEFTCTCLKNDTCAAAKAHLEENPKQYLSNLQVFYSLRTQRSTKKTISIKAEHVQSGYMFSSLDQMFPEANTVYMTAEDVNQMTLEIASNVLATEVTDEGFVSSDYSVNIVKMLEAVALRPQPVSSQTFQAQMWDSVFWHDENSRPDKVTQSLNDVYDKYDSTLQNVIKEFVSNQETVSGQAAVSFLGISLGGGGSESSHHMSNFEREELATLMTEAQQVSQWNGEKFIPKAMQLQRINLSKLRSTDVVTSVQVQVSKTSSEVDATIKVLPSADTVGQLAKQRADLRKLEQRFEENDRETVGMIAAWFGNENAPLGWLPCNGMLLNCSGAHSRLCQKTGRTNTPDFRDRFPIGTNTGSDFAGYVGKTGGEATHRLSQAEMPHHNHGTFSTETWIPFTGLYYQVHFLDNGNLMHQFRSENIYKNLQTMYAGESLPHNNLPPFLAVNFVIRY